MTNMIHVDAVIHPDARVHPTAVIGPKSKIGAGCIIEPYAVVGPYTEMGSDNRVCSFSVVGGAAQSRSTDPDASFQLIIGNGNVFREGVTVSRGTEAGLGFTSIGDHCLIMAQAHIGHDCRLGDRVTLSNQVSLAGHVTAFDNVTCGGHSAVHQFVKLGQQSFLAANSMVSQDIPPFCMAAGDRARLMGINTTGLTRAGYSKEERAAISKAFRILCRQRTKTDEAQIKDLLSSAFESVRLFARFFRTSDRGIARVATVNSVCE